MATLPPNSAQFSLSVVGDRTGETIKADFTTTQILSHRQQLLADRLFREYLGGENPAQADEDAKQRARFLADINCALVNPVPQFWREKGMGLDLLDDNVLTDVWAGVIKVQSDKAKEIQKRAEAAAGKLKNKVENPDEVTSDEKDEE